MRIAGRSAFRGVIILLSLVIAACASVADKNIAYRDSRLVPPLAIPEGLDSPVTDKRLEIPAATAATPSEASDFEVGVHPPNIIPVQSAAP